MNFKLDSLWKFYNDSGFVTAEYNYREGLKHGLQKAYYENGIIQSEENDSMSVKHGIFKLYDTEGKLYKSIPFTNGVENGLAKEYRKDGVLITVTNYRNGYFQREEKINRLDKNGLKQGLYRNYFENDKVQFEGTYKDDVKDGIFKEYSADGRVIKKKNIEWEFLFLPSLVEDKEKFEVKRKYYPTGATKIVRAPIKKDYLKVFSECTMKKETSTAQKFLLRGNCCVLVEWITRDWNRESGKNIMKVASSVQSETMSMGNEMVSGSSRMKMIHSNKQAHM
ncbi:MAG: toxin-antitoxin system YwqK family antitoxin [Bacteroidetes bacterium]|nr:toxin-antitoxin system YwqK family antitoxin [Bacteroidota bacterium]